MGDAFDLIVTPIVPDLAVQTIKLSRWHYVYALLRASRERVPDPGTDGFHLLAVVVDTDPDCHRPRIALATTVCIN